MGPGDRSPQAGSRDRAPGGGLGHVDMVYITDVQTPTYVEH